MDSISRAREESITVDTLSLEQLGNLLAKFGDSVSEELQSQSTFDKSVNDCRHQPENNVLKPELTENEHLGKTISQVERGGNKSIAKGNIESPKEDTLVCARLRKKILDRTLLLLLISVVSIGIILPFCLVAGTTIYEKSSTVEFNFTNNTTCDSVSKQLQIC